MEKYQEIERSIIKKYRKDIWRCFVKAVKDYQLIEENDEIMVCISGGKDSFLLAKCIQELKRHGKVNFNAHYVVMNPGYSAYHRKQIEENAQLLNIPIEIFESDIFSSVEKIDSKGACYLCARMRRGCLYSYAKKLGCNKIALGHHLNDVIETTLLSMFYASELKTMMPKLHSDHFEGMELIRPLYFVKEENIIAWAKSNGLSFINCACKFTQEVASSKEQLSKRKEIKKIIASLQKEIPQVDDHIMKAIDNVNLDCILGVKKNQEYHSFLETYDINK